MKNGKRMRNNGVFFITLIGITLMFMCTTNTPTGPAGGSSHVRISLLSDGNTEEDYTGTDLEMIVKFTDSVKCSFDTIKIHSTDANFYIPNASLLNKKVKQVTIPLYWKSKLKLKTDSLTKMPYDTVYVQVGMSRSNVVRVNILNLPPVVDSVVVGDTVFHTFSRIQNLNIFNYYVRDSLYEKDLRLRVYAHDLDATKFNNTWENLGDDIYLVWNSIVNPTIATYKSRKGNFRDLVQLVVYDTDASVEVKINIIQLSGTETLLDSIVYRDSINDTTFRDNGTAHYTIRAIVLDTAAVRAYPRTHGGTITWKAIHGRIITNTAIDSGGFAITYICTSSVLRDTLMTDGIRFMDSLRCVHKNSYGDDSTTKTIMIYKKPANRNPIIDSIFIESKTFKKDFIHTVEAGSTIKLKAYAHDPEGGVKKGTLTYAWQGNLNGSLYNATGDTTSYTAASASYSDTIFCIAADSLHFTDTQAIVVVSNRPPVIDSVRIDSVKFSSGYQYIVSAGKSIVLKAYAHDPEGSKMSHKWQGSIKGSLSSTIGDSIRYTAPDTTSIDTVYVVVSDSSGFADIQLIVLPCNNRPIVDSMRVDTARKVPLSAVDSVFTHSADTSDTFTIKIFVRNLDAATLNDAITCLWRYKNASLQPVSATADSITYISASSAYSDTVSVTLTDKYKATIRKKVIISFKK